MTPDDGSGRLDAVQQLAREYAEARRRSDPACYVQQPRDGGVQYATFRYLPEHHFRLAYNRVTRDLETDGGFDDLHRGKQRATVYYWLDPQTGAALHHTGVNDEEAIPFFPDEGTARDYLENRAGTGDPEQYTGLSLYKTRRRKVADAVDVLTDQAGFDDFVPDSGI